MIGRIGGVASIAALLVAAGCAGPSVPRPQVDLERQACESELNPTYECVELLTRPEFESRAQVDEAEAKREADAFRRRLEDLRQAEERRQERQRAATATVAVARLLKRTPPPPPHSEPPAVAVPAGPPAGPRLPSPPTPSPPEPAPAGPVPAPARFMPTPEQFLRAGRCLLEQDHGAGLTALGAYRRAPQASPGAAGRWALALTDADALVARITGELAHRKLAKSGPVCTSSGLRPVVGLLRSLLGPSPTSRSRALAYGRGLTRLARELEVRAGLPRAD